MRLGFHYHVPAVYRDDSIYMPGYLGKFVDSLASYCESVTCFMHEPLLHEIKFMDYNIKFNNVKLVNIGKHTRVYKREVFGKYFVRNIYKYRHMVDIMLIRGPSPLLPYVAKAMGAAPVALLLVGDYLKGIDALQQPWWRKEIIRLWAHWNTFKQDEIAKVSLTMVNSYELLERYQKITKHVQKVQTTTLSAKDIFCRDDTCEGATIHLLYTGRIIKAKGLFEMIDALSQVNNGKTKVKLNIVGWAPRNSTILDELLLFGKAKGIDGEVIYHGYVPHGPQLYEHYKKADIYIMASTHSFEGFPRTIWEAMAQSLPVIATKVGSIPYQLTDGNNAILVEPRDSKALADAISEIASNKQLRQALIKEGRKLASQNTLEIQSKKMISELERYLRGQNE